MAHKHLHIENGRVVGWKIASNPLTEIFEYLNTICLDRLAAVKVDAQAKLSEEEAEARTWIKSLLEKDKASTQPVAWSGEASAHSIAEALNILLFQGMLAERYELIGLDGLTLTQGIQGQTSWRGDDRVTILVDLQNSQRLRPGNPPLNRQQKGSRLIGTISHEMLHAVAMVYGCKCDACYQNVYSTTVGTPDEGGHGKAWRKTARALNRRLLHELGDSAEWPDWQPKFPGISASIDTMSVMAVIPRDALDEMQLMDDSTEPSSTEPSTPASLF